MAASSRLLASLRDSLILLTETTHVSGPLGQAILPILLLFFLRLLFDGLSLLLWRLRLLLLLWQSVVVIVVYGPWIVLLLRSLTHLLDPSLRLGLEFLSEDFVFALL